MLSLGEQQRLGLARALLLQPQYLFLDEATASLDEASEAALYRLLEKKLPATTIVSIGHRSTLLAFHQRQVELSRDGDRIRIARAQRGFHPGVKTEDRGRATVLETKGAADRSAAPLALSFERTYFRLAIAVRSTESLAIPVAPHQLEPTPPGLIGVTLPRPEPSNVLVKA